MDTRRILDLPLLSSIRDAAATIQAILYFAAPVVAFLAIGYATWGRHHIHKDTVVAVVLALVVLAASCAVTYILSLRSAETGAYDITELNATLFVERVGDHHRYGLTKELTIRARRNAIRIVDFRWQWTGQGAKNASKIAPLFKEHMLFDGRTPEEDSYIYRWLYLGKALRRGEVEKVGVLLSVEDDLEPMRPFFTEFSHGYRTRRMKLTVRFPRLEDPDAVEGLVWPINHSTQPSSILQVPTTRNLVSNPDLVEYSLTVDDPHRDRRYGFRWKWS